MNVRSRIVACAALIAATITPVLASPVLASPLAVHAQHTAGPAADGARRWLARYPRNSSTAAIPRSVVVSPDGSTAFVGGPVAVAYSAATGAQLWAAPTAEQVVSGTVLSPDGSRLFMTGRSQEPDGTLQYTTVALATATGAVLWTANYHGPGAGTDQAASIAVSPDGSRVFVTGYSSNTTDPGVFANAFATVAYNAATGARLWLARYARGSMNSEASAVAVSPDGATVFVTGTAEPVLTRVTAAYDAATGARRWLTAYRPAAPQHGATGTALAVSPDGATVFVVGLTRIAGAGGPHEQQQYQAQAYVAATGTVRWTSASPAPGGPGVFGGAPVAMALSPDGATVFVTGQDYLRGNPAYGTVAFSAATGAKLWSSQAALNNFGLPSAIAVNPSGSKVLVTGYGGLPAGGTGQAATVAVSAATGATLWTRYYPGPVPGQSAGTGVAVSPGGAVVFVTGRTGAQYFTLAYRS